MIKSRSVETIEEQVHGLHLVVANIRNDAAERGRHARISRHQCGLQADILDQGAHMEGPAAAEGHGREPAGIMTALDRDEPDGTGHLAVRDPHDGLRRLHGIEAQRLRHVLCDSGLCRLDVEALHAFGERLARKGAEDMFRTAADLLLWWMARMIRGGAAGTTPAELVAGESAAMQRLLGGRSLDRWLQLWENTARLFARTESAYLDRKQVWIAALLDIAGPARP